MCIKLFTAGLCSREHECCECCRDRPARWHFLCFQLSSSQLLVLCMKFLWHSCLMTKSTVTFPGSAAPWHVLLNHVSSKRRHGVGVRVTGWLGDTHHLSVSLSVTAETKTSLPVRCGMHENLPKLARWLLRLKPAIL